MTGYSYIERNPSTEEYLNVRNSVTSDVPGKDVVEIALKNSLFAVCAIWQEQVIGYGRVIGDGGMYYYIQDVFVMPDHQGKGVGREIMNAIMNYFRLNVPGSALIGLMSAEGAV